MKRIIAAVAAITSVLACVLMALGPGTANAVDWGCVDYAIAQPTAVHLNAAADSLTIKFKQPGDKVTGTCQYYNNSSEQHWYMQVFLTTGPSQPYPIGYIWVQRLSYGSSHTCDDDGHPYSIGSGNCPLIQH
jgi:hypothetical protein